MSPSKNKPPAKEKIPMIKKRTISPIKKIGRWLASPEIFFYTVFWLLVLMVLGTVAQKYIGLNAAQNKYFSAWFIYVGVIPVPAGRLTMAVAFFNLLAKLLFASPLKWQRAGIHITHLGSLLLLAGGMITALYAYEGSMFIYEGESSNYFEDYRKLELAVIEVSNPKYDQVTSFPQGYLSNKSVLVDPSFAGTIIIEKFYTNCEMVPRNNQLASTSILRGLARHQTLKPKLDAKEAHENQSGAIIKIIGVNAQTDGTYLLLERLLDPPLVKLGNATFRLVLRHKHYPLNFRIHLDNFEKQVHPGTSTPRSFQSEVHITRDNDTVGQRALIWMNHPLRTDGYTFFQSSYVQGKREATILAVVHNSGRLFPYISSIVICIGMLIHLTIIFIQSSTKERKKEVAK